MPTEMFSALLGYAFVTAVTPGLNNFMLLASGGHFGGRRTIPHMIGIAAVFSSEALRYPESETRAAAACEPPRALNGLNCAGFGSSVCVTATFGLLAAGEVLRALAGGATVPGRHG